MRTAILTALIVAVLSAPAEATTLVNPDGSTSQPYQTWANQAKVPTPQISLKMIVAPGQCAVTTNSTVWAAGGCTVVDDWIGIEPSACAPEGLDDRRWMWLNCKQTFYHELGHNLKLDAATQAQAAAILHTPNDWTVSGTEQSVAERFADAYSMCALGRRSIRVDVGGDTVAYFQGIWPLGPKHYRAICKLIRESAITTRKAPRISPRGF